MTFPPLMPVAEALAAVLAKARPTAAESLSIDAAQGRWLAQDIVALRTQPPFAASAMDGYAVRAADAVAGAVLRIVGESAAGGRFAGSIGPGEAARIFTGAPVPTGADAVLMQEYAERLDGAIRVQEPVASGSSIRPAGQDFREGDLCLRSGQRLNAIALALLASAGRGTVSVARQPRVALLATGDELVPPGEIPGPDQIVSSNNVMIAAMIAQAGGQAIDLGIAADRLDVICGRIEEAAARRADVLVTLGGASVGDHDLVRAAMDRMGFTLDLWRIAMRPGKPLIVGDGRGMRLIGLPGNPVSAAVCAMIFLQPLLRAMQGDGTAGEDRTEPGILAVPLPQNGDRQDFVRAALRIAPGNLPEVTPFPLQDSSMLSVLAAAGALIVRPPFDAAQPAGAPCRILRIA